MQIEITTLQVWEFVRRNRVNDPLFRDMFDAVGSRIAAYFEVVAALDVVGALRYGDDMGFKTQTLLSPDVFRKVLFPWHRKIVETAHRYAKPVILHAAT